jgi:hypothetical protein
MSWTPFRFTRSRKPIRKPIRRSHLLLEELESRITPSTNVITYHNDNSSTGQNLNETVLTPGNVNSNANTFGKLFATGVDGQVYAQPLYVAGVNITTGANQGTHNVVFVATEHDSLYAIDADNGTVLWQDPLLHAVHGGTVSSVPSADVNNGDLAPEIGVTATPVIDAGTGTLYVEAKTKEVAADGSHYIHQLYAVNLADGSFKFGGPVVIADSVGDTYVSGPTVHGTGDGSSNGTVFFDALRQLDRPALTEDDGNIYLAFASHGDHGPYHGWVLSYSAATLALNGVLNTTPNGSAGGIWQSGGLIAVDAQGNLYFETGNGTFDTTLNAAGMPQSGDYGDSFVKVALDPTTSATNQNVNGWGLKVVDYFTPFDQANLNNGDLDLGSGGLVLLPDSVGSAAHPQLLVGAGKEGRIYLIDRDNMGHFDPNTDHVVQETSNTAISGSFGTPAYFNGQIYYVGGSNIGNANDVGKTFSISGGQMSLTPTWQGPDSYGYPGATPSISANGTTNGIVWALDKGSNELRAYDAGGFNTELYTSATDSSRDALTGSVVKFSVPTIADGQVYVGTSDALNVYGLIPQATQPPAAPTNLSASARTGTSIGLTWADNSTAPNTATGFDIEQSTDGVHFTQVATATARSTAATVGGLQPSTTYTFRIRAFDAVGNSSYSNTASATTASRAPRLDLSIIPASTVVTVNDTDAITFEVANMGDGTLPAGGTTLTVTLSAGLTMLAGTPLTFNVGSLATGQSATFHVTVTAARPGSQVVSGTVTSSDTNPATVTATTTATGVPPTSAPNPPTGGTGQAPTPQGALTLFGFGFGPGFQPDLFAVDSAGEVFAVPLGFLGATGPPTFLSSDVVFANVHLVNGVIVDDLASSADPTFVMAVVSFNNPFVFQALLQAILTEI